jgi:hypothetical protein
MRDGKGRDLHGAASDGKLLLCELAVQAAQAVYGPGRRQLGAARVEREAVLFVQAAEILQVRRGQPEPLQLR